MVPIEPNDIGCKVSARSLWEGECRQSRLNACRLLFMNTVAFFNVMTCTPQSQNHAYFRWYATNWSVCKLLSHRYLVPALICSFRWCPIFLHLDHGIWLLFWTTLCYPEWWLVLDGWRNWGSGTRQKWKKVGITKCLFLYRLSDLTKEQLLRNRLAFCMDSSASSYMVIIIRAWMSIILVFFESWTLERKLAGTENDCVSAHDGMKFVSSSVEMPTCLSARRCFLCRPLSDISGKSCHGIFSWVCRCTGIAPSFSLILNRHGEIAGNVARRTASYVKRRS
jgi:hypothetical protein